MKLDRILVATDTSDASRHAYRAALDLARRAAAAVTVMRTITGQRVPVGAYRDSSDAHREALERWAAGAGENAAGAVQVHVGFGHPSIEIPRHAEATSADLIVLGRKPRTQASRFRQGDTADEVIRRSRLPCLLVPPGATPIRRILAAVDGTVRGRRVVQEACDVARSIGATIHAVTVEPWTSEELSKVAPAPLAGTLGLRSELGEKLTVRAGSIFEQVLAEIGDIGADLLAIGVRRGGAPGTLELGGVGRHLAHTAPCPVLTIPL